MVHVLYEDEHIIVVWKPAGVESQSSRGFGADMVSEIRKYLCILYTKISPKAGEPYVGVIHRLDKPVSGVMVYAKEKKAAASLSKQVSEGKMEKKYLAVLCGKVDKSVDNFVDYLLKDEKLNKSGIVDRGISGSKRAELSYRILEEEEVEPYGTLSLAEITLMTGRHHQIRVQMAGHGLPLWGDNKYNPLFAERASAGHAGTGRLSAGQMSAGQMSAGRISAGQMNTGRVNVALASYRLAFTHPVTGERMEFERDPDGAIFQRFSRLRAKKE